jgi:hypothetical protein
MHNDQENVKFYVTGIVVVFIFVVKIIIFFLKMSFVKTTMK